MKKVRILSIDGGGIRGILPGVILTQLELKLRQQTNNNDLRLSEMFDFMAGTSTGGILTLAYLTPDTTNKPKFTSQEAVNLYLDRGDEIFSVNIWQKMKSGIGLTDEKYNASALEKALNDNFENKKLSELLKPCIVCSYDVKNGRPHFFRQHKASNPIYNFLVRDVARATSAAPTYFETALVKNEIGTPFPLIDGGVFANNPSLVAYSEVRNMDLVGIKTPTAKDMMIVSIGTGSNAESYDYEKTKDWGAASWIKPIIEIMMSGNSQTVHHHLHKIFGTLDDKDKSDYHRLEPKVVNAKPDMDNASEENMQKLKEDALSYLSQSAIDDELDRIAEKLIRYGDGV